MQVGKFQTNSPQEEVLAKLAMDARRLFSSGVFWTIPDSDELPIEARNVGSQLAKHGGMPGLAHAAKIENALRSCGFESWR